MLQAVHSSSARPGLHGQRTRGAVPPTGCHPVLTCKYARSGRPEGCESLCLASPASPAASSSCLCRSASAPVSSSWRRPEASEVSYRLRVWRRSVCLLNPKEDCRGKKKQSRWERYQSKTAVIFDSIEGVTNNSFLGLALRQTFFCFGRII